MLKQYDQAAFLESILLFLRVPCEESGYKKKKKMTT